MSVAQADDFDPYLIEEVEVKPPKPTKAEKKAAKKLAALRKKQEETRIIMRVSY